jgi:hypothetical protein
MEEELTEEIKKLKEPAKQHARKRNHRSLLIIILLTLVVFLVIVTIVDFVNISIARIDEQFALVVTFTVGVSVLMGIYAACLIHAYTTEPKIWPLFDMSVPENLGDQLEIHVIPPFCIFVAMAALWLSYAKTGGGTQFGTTDGEIDSGATLVSFGCLITAILAVVKNVYSFFRVHPPPLTYVVTQGVPWSSRRSEYLVEETSDGITTLKIQKK